MTSNKIFSSKKELKLIALILTNYSRLPFTEGIIPGSIMEHVIAHVRDGRVLTTYDFVDVIRESDKTGWQIKSTKAKTPVTWKRAKIPNAKKLITASKQTMDGRKELGKAIIDFCNKHVKDSLDLYNLDSIGYARLIIHDDGKVTYFEKLLCKKDRPEIFKASDFIWTWSKPKKTKKKEQLSALHGTHKKTKKKWFAWHGLGENQLHFSGESNWWPRDKKHKICFKLPTGSKKLTMDEFLDLIKTLRRH